MLKTNAEIRGDKCFLTQDTEDIWEKEEPQFIDNHWFWKFSSLSSSYAGLNVYYCVNFAGLYATVKDRRFDSKVWKWGYGLTSL